MLECGLLQAFALDLADAFFEEEKVAGPSIARRLKNVGPLIRLPKKKGPEEPGMSQDEIHATDAKIRGHLKSRYNVNPYLGGSMATGLALPGKADFDYGIRVKSRAKFDDLNHRLGQRAAASPYDKPGTDYRVFTTKIHGQDVDLAVLLGDKGKIQRDALQKAKAHLDANPGRRQEILAQKKKLKNAVILPEYRYKKFKRGLDKELGLPRFTRDKIEAAPAAASPVAHPPAHSAHVPTVKVAEALHLARSDVFGHRTHDIRPLLKSKSLRSAADLGRQGKLKTVESRNPFSRKRVSASGKKLKLRKEVFITKGILPPSKAYGHYGVMFRKRKASEAKYSTMIPGEHVTDKVTSKLHFIVPDHEHEQWSKSHPNHSFVRESHVPAGKRIAKARSTRTLIDRVKKHGIKLRQATEEVKVAAKLSEAEKQRRRQAYYVANRQRILQKNKAYRKANAQKIRRRQLVYRQQVHIGARRQRKRLHQGQSYSHQGYKTGSMPLLTAPGSGSAIPKLKTPNVSGLAQPRPGRVGTRAGGKLPGGTPASPFSGNTMRPLKMPGQT